MWERVWALEAEQACVHAQLLAAAASWGGRAFAALDLLGVGERLEGVQLKHSAWSTHLHLQLASALPLSPSSKREFGKMSWLSKRRGRQGRATLTIFCSCMHCRLLLAAHFFGLSTDRKEY